MSSVRGQLEASDMELNKLKTLYTETKNKLQESDGLVERLRTDKNVHNTRGFIKFLVDFYIRST